MLFRKTLLSCVIIVMFICGFVRGSQYWSLTNQMKVEERPYTRTPKDPSTTGPTFRAVGGAVQLAKFREMHRYCDGQCFYAPATCASSAPTDFYSNCQVAASVGTHNQDPNGELYCDFFGKEDSLRSSFCSTDEVQQKYQKSTGKLDQFYSITLHQNLDSVGTLSCENKWNEITGRSCRRTEFVGIAFLNSLAPDVDYDVEDLWYLCIIDETHKGRVSMWTNENGTGSAHQVLGTKPHLESGAGVVFSKVMLDEDLDSLGCQFVIQESNMSLLDPPKNAAFFDDKANPIRIKLGYGNVERNLITDDVERPIFTTVFRKPEIKPTDEIFFTALSVTLKDKVADIKKELDKEEEAENQVKELISKCDNAADFKDIYVVCYPPNKQKNCVHTGRCPIMFIVEIPKSDTSFDTIKAYLYSSLPDYKSLRKVERPTGYASVGFSLDQRMGRDVVITCHASGRDQMGVYVSLNFETANVYPGKVDYNNIIYNQKTWGTVGQSRIICSWEMKTKFVVNMFEYEPDYRQIIHPGQSEKLEYDFKKKAVYLLVAAGNRNYPKGKIVYHDFREVLDTPFNKTTFFAQAKADRLVFQFGLLFCLLVLLSTDITGVFCV